MLFKTIKRLSFLNRLQIGHQLTLGQLFALERHFQRIILDQRGILIANGHVIVATHFKDKLGEHVIAMKHVYMQFTSNGLHIARRIVN